VCMVAQRGGREGRQTWERRIARGTLGVAAEGGMVDGTGRLYAIRYDLLCWYVTFGCSYLIYKDNIETVNTWLCI
jgi:hypothetical protein